MEMKERVTKRLNGCEAYVYSRFIQECAFTYDDGEDCYMGEVVQRLADYEDLGMTPAEIKQMKEKLEQIGKAESEQREFECIKRCYEYSRGFISD